MQQHGPGVAERGGDFVWTESEMSVTQEERHEYGEVSTTAARSFFFFLIFWVSAVLATKGTEGIGVGFGK